MLQTHSSCSRRLQHFAWYIVQSPKSQKVITEGRDLRPAFQMPLRGNRGNPANYNTEANSAMSDKRRVLENRDSFMHTDCLKNQFVIRVLFLCLAEVLDGAVVKTSISGAWHILSMIQGSWVWTPVGFIMVNYAEILLACYTFNVLIC